MNLLAEAISRVEATVIAVLCILVVLFVLMDIALVISLHRQNKKLNMRDEITAPDDDTPSKQ